MKELYELYERYIFRYLYGLTLDFYKAEELTQETFFQLLKSLHRFRGDCHVSTWIYKIARNVFNEYCRKNKVITISTEEGLLDIPNGVKPTVFSLGEKKDTLLVYTFKSFVERDAIVKKV
jgi:RNA polymerase sigma-70 factor, ECF subfamily